VKEVEHATPEGPWKSLGPLVPPSNLPRWGANAQTARPVLSQSLIFGQNPKIGSPGEQ
jgi:hypothetical protein